MMGVSPEKAAEHLSDIGVDVLALNCGTGIDMEVAEEISRLGRRAFVVKADVSEEEDVASMMEFVSADQLRRQFEVNVFGTVAVTQAMLPLLRRARGRIV